MTEPSRVQAALRRAAAWSLGWLFAAALYLLLIDTTSLPELIVGAGAAALAATGFELAREHHVAGTAIRLGWLVSVLRPVSKVPSDVVIVSLAAVRQLLRPRAVQGEFREVTFRRVDDESLDLGRRALAEAMGSFAPNTIIVGVDSSSQRMLAHQLRRSGGPEAIDLLGLG